MNSAVPRVSAIVPVYNGEAFLEIAVESALSQTYRDLEVVIVDDGSTDRSGQIADALAARHPDRVRVIHQPNGGFCASRNTGMAAARGEFIALLDCDDAWWPRHIEACVECLDRDGRVGMVHGAYQVMDEQGTPKEVPPGRWQTPRASAWDAIFLRQEHVMCVTVVFRRSLIEQLGALDMAFNRLGCEDRDLWLRIASVSELVYLPEVQAYYRVHGNNISKQQDRMMKARLMLVDKHARTGRGAALERRARAAVYAERAYGLRTEGLMGPALAHYGRALLQYPWSLQTWKGTAAALLARR